MIFSFIEGAYGCNINMTPETPDEVAKLMRVAKNSKAVKPAITLYFESTIPTMSIWVHKIKPSAQVNSLKPFKND